MRFKVVRNYIYPHHIEIRLTLEYAFALLDDFYRVDISNVSSIKQLSQRITYGVSKLQNSLSDFKAHFIFVYKIIGKAMTAVKLRTNHLKKT